MTTTIVTSTSAICNWPAVSGATSYTFRYRLYASGNSFIHINNVTSTSYPLSGLQSGKKYRWSVKANCSGNYSTASYFTTLAAGATSASIEEDYKIEIYPNPVSSKLNIVINGWNEELNTMVDIYSVNGAMLGKINCTNRDISLNTTQYAKGIYFIRVLSKNKEPIVLRFIKD